MRRLVIAVALLTLLGSMGCRLFEPDPPQYYYPQYAPVYSQACPPGYVPAVTNPCSPATGVPATTPVPRQPLLPLR